MYIIFDHDNFKYIDEKYLILELDTFKVDDDTFSSYCLIDSESIDINSISNIENSKNLHNELIRNYKKGDYKFCTDVIGHLRGRFGGELDSFYDVILERIEGLSTIDLDGWTGIIETSEVTESHFPYNPSKHGKD